MLSAVRRRVTYANVVMTLALVFAMAGGAYAAKKYLITSTKQISPKVLKQLKGKAGAVGAQGPAGPAGAAGSQGPAGPAGKDGATGPAGKDGATGPQGPAGAAGKEGPAGKEGKEGSPWTAGGTLPSSKTETGTWTIETPDAKGFQYGAASFPIPLGSPVAEANIHVMEFEEKTAECPGSVENPQAVAPEAGTPVFCAYQWYKPSNVLLIAGTYSGIAGLELTAIPAKTGEGMGAGGSFAVTEG